MSTVIVATPLGPRPVDAIWQEGGLAVHQSVGADHRYTVSHVRSGFAVRAYLDSSELAITFATDVLSCGDWTQDFFATVADKALQTKYRKVARPQGRSQASRPRAECAAGEGADRRCVGEIRAGASRCRYGELLMFAVGTTALAKVCYEAWWAERVKLRLSVFGLPPSWSGLSSDQQRVFEAVAEAAGRLLADAMGQTE